MSGTNVAEIAEGVYRIHTPVEKPVVETDIVGPSEKMRGGMDYFSRAPNARSVLERLASLEPRTLACMHGSAWRGEGKRPLLALADALAPVRPA